MPMVEGNGNDMPFVVVSDRVREVVHRAGLLPSVGEVADDRPTHRMGQDSERAVGVDT